MGLCKEDGHQHGHSQRFVTMNMHLYPLVSLHFTALTMKVPVKVHMYVYVSLQHLCCIYMYVHAYINIHTYLNR